MQPPMRHRITGPQRDRVAAVARRGVTERHGQQIGVVTQRSAGIIMTVECIALTSQDRAAANGDGIGFQAQKFGGGEPALFGIDPGNPPRPAA
jgi:hypothetical protein